jgi:hypothetical protein
MVINMNEYIEKILLMALVLCFVGYFLSYVKEKLDFNQLKVPIKSEKVTQTLIDSLDYKVFKLGNTRLNIGDEIKVYLKDNKTIKGTVLGAKRKMGALCLITEMDEVVELRVGQIKKLKVVTKYGRLF